MRKTPANVHELVEPAINSLGYELLGIEYHAQGKHSLLRVYIDNDAGITADDCARVSHQVSGLLDVEDIIRGDYNLEVSSPGLDRPLFTLAHFERFVGEMATVYLVVPIEGRRKFSGIIQAVMVQEKVVQAAVVQTVSNVEYDNAAAEGIVLEVDGTAMELSLSQIDKANLVAQI